MRGRRPLVLLLAVTAVQGGTPAQAYAAAGLTISVPAAASLGSVASGSGTVSGALGNVTVTTTNGGSWTSTVSASAFTTGGGTTAETIPASSVGYLSGAVTASSGLSVGLCTPGQTVTPVSLASPATAMSCGSLVSLTATSVTWRPTITITLPTAAVAGTYTGTITHSVA